MFRWLVLTLASVGAAVSPPDDGGKSYLTVCGRADDAHFQRVCGWLNGPLKALRDKTHYTELRADSPMFRERYRPTFGLLPAVRVQSSDGKVFYQASGANLPDSPDQLAQAIGGVIRRDCPDGKCLPWRHKAEPQPEPKPDVTPDPEPQPLAVTPDTTHDETAWPAILIAIAAGIAGIAIQWKRTYAGA